MTDFSWSTIRRFLSKSEIISFNSWLSTEINCRACSITTFGSPSLAEISKALLRPGTPNKNRYVGCSVSLSNSILALIVPTRLYP